MVVSNCVAELQNEINQLKRQLISALNENQMLKVKYRKLENETLKKDRWLQQLVNREKHMKLRKKLSENANAIVSNLQKRNKELEEILAQKDAMNRKYQNEARTARLYSHRTELEVCGRGRWAESLLRSQSPSVSPSRSPSRSSSRPHSSWTIANQRNGHLNDYVNKGAPPTIRAQNASDPLLRGVCMSRSRELERMEKVQTTTIQTLKETVQSLTQEQIDAKKAIRLKNLEVENLTSELKALRSRLKSQIRDPETYKRRSSSTGCLSEGQLYRCSRSKSRPHGHRSDHEKRQKSSKLIKAHEISCLEAVEEQCEDITANIISVRDLKQQICKRNGKDQPCSKKRSRLKAEIEPKLKHTKTEIEYLIDSEVSSDGEEVHVAYTN